MSATHFGVIYTVGGGQVYQHGLYYADSDAELNAYTPAPNSFMVKVSVGPYPNTQAWLNAIHQAMLTDSGMASVGDLRCCVVDLNGNVVNVILANPSYYTDPDSTHTLVVDPTHTVAVTTPPWTWTAGGGFVAPPAPAPGPPKSAAPIG